MNLNYLHDLRIHPRVKRRKRAKKQEHVLFVKLVLFPEEINLHLNPMLLYFQVALNYDRQEKNKTTFHLLYSFHEQVKP